jgi:hypothetical protein
LVILGFKLRTSHFLGSTLPLNPPYQSFFVLYILR